MKSGMKHSMKLLSATVIACLMATCLLLVACGGSGSSSGSAASASASGSATSASASASASATTNFEGSWLVAAAESQGLLMGGNFGEMFGAAEGITLVINADGTGTMAMGKETQPITWAAEGPDSFNLTVQSADGASAQQAVLVTAKNDALFMPFDQDGQQATLIFTKDGNYADAKQITLDGAKPITSEAQLLGKWNTVGMNMGGISMYGDAEAMAAAMSGQEMWVEFKEGGKLEMNSGEGTWAVNADGATITTTDVTGTNTVPVVMLGDEIAVDYSAVYQGMELIVVFAKA